MALDDTIIEAEATPGMLDRNSEMSRSLRADLAGKKGSNSARDQWATDAMGGDIATHQTAGGSYTRLDEAELATQQMHILYEAEATGAINAQDALRVLEANAKGGVTLTRERSDIFSRIAIAGGLTVPTGTPPPGPARARRPPTRNPAPGTPLPP